MSTSFDGLSEKILVNDIPKHGTGCIEIIKEKSECGHEECWKGHCLYLQQNTFNNLKRKRFDDAEEPWIMENGNINNNPFSGQEWNPWGQQTYTMPTQLPFSHIVKDVVCTGDTFRKAEALEVSKNNCNTANTTQSRTFGELFTS